MIRSIAEDTEAFRCLELIDRCAPRMMKAGGGRLIAEQDEGHANPVTRDESGEMQRLHREEGLAGYVIAKRFGRSRSCVMSHIAGECFRGLRKSKYVHRIPEIAALRAAGKTMPQIARETGLHYGIVECLVRKLQRAEQHAA